MLLFLKYNLHGTWLLITLTDQGDLGSNCRKTVYKTEKEHSFTLMYIEAGVSIIPDVPLRNICLSGLGWTTSLRLLPRGLVAQFLARASHWIGKSVSGLNFHLSPEIFPFIPGSKISGLVYNWYHYISKYWHWIFQTIPCSLTLLCNVIGLCLMLQDMYVITESAWAI